MKNLLTKNAEINYEWIVKQEKLDDFIQKWLNDEIEMSNQEINILIEQTENEIEELKNKANMLFKDFQNQKKEEIEKSQAKSIVRNEFGVHPDEIIITGGIGAPNTSESHLIGRKKTEEELDFEKETLLKGLKLRVLSKEISLGEASKFKNAINVAYKSENEVINMGDNKKL